MMSDDPNVSPIHYRDSSSAMNNPLPVASRDPSLPLRCAVIGLTVRGEFLAEVLATRPEFKFVAAAYSRGSGPSAEEPSRAELLTQRVIEREQLLSLTLDWVCVASPIKQRAADAIAALKSGHNVVLDVPVALAFDDVEAVVSAARETQRLCRAWFAPRQEADFEKARELVRGQKLGRLRTVSFCLRQLAAHFLPDFEGSTRFGDERELGVLDVFGWRYLDQLVRLINEPVVRVFGVINRGQLCFNSLATCGAMSDRDSGFLAVIEFASGVVAQFEIDLASSVPGSGAQWVLQGERGSYANGKQCLLEPDGEIFEVDVPAPSADSPQASAEFDAEAELRAMLDVARIIAAIKESSESRTVVTLK